MFSRRPDRPKEEPRYAPPSTSSRPTDLVAVPPSDTPPGVWGSAPVPATPTGSYRPVPAGAGAGDATVVAANDQAEGVLRSGQGVLVLGSFVGSIESESWIRIAEGATVRADLLAQEIVIAGRFAGRIVAKGRLEITPTGQLQGEIETPRLLLHEGGLIDGALYMTRKDAVRLGPPPVAVGPAPTASPSAPSAPVTAPVQPSPAGPAKPGSVRGSGPAGVSPRSRGASHAPAEAAQTSMEMPAVTSSAPAATPIQSGAAPVPSGAGQAVPVSAAAASPEPTIEASTRS